MKKILKIVLICFIVFIGAFLFSTAMNQATYQNQRKFECKNICLEQGYQAWMGEFPDSCYCYNLIKQSKESGE